MKNKIGSISLIRTLAILGVVLIHSLPNQNQIELDLFSARIVTFISSILRWTVPAFVMITGALLLPRCENYKKCIKRAGRIFVALLVFGFVMAALQNVFESGFTRNTMLLSLKDVVSGNTWDVMWYLYMVIGLYLFMPIVSIFVKHADKREIQYILVLLFVFTSVIEIVNKMVPHAVGFYLPVDSVYLFYLLAGYYIFTYRPLVDKRMLWSILAVLAIVYFVLAYHFVRFNTIEYLVGYKSPITVMLSLCVFGMLIDLNIDCKAVELISDNAFGIYLTHCFYIHILDKVFGVYTLPYSKVALLIPVYVAVVFASLATSMVLRKIPLIKKLI